MKHSDFEKMKDYDLVSNIEFLIESDDCLNSFIEMIENDITTSEVYELPGDFTDKVMDKITRDKTKKGTKQNNFRNMMIFYVSAACITLFFTAYGVFDLIFDNAVDMTSKVFTNSNLTTGYISNGWSDRLTEKTSEFLNSIEK